MIIELEKISNIRDLGGIVTANGYQIKKARLIRSSALYSSSISDAEKIINTYKVNNIVDFRSTKEKNEKPHPKNLFPNINYYHIPVVDEVKHAVTRDKKSEYLIKTSSEGLSVDDAIKIIENFYWGMPLWESSQKTYRKFFEILLNNKNGSTLWHCSLGKDRAGIASVLIEYVLGVSYQNILKDYLLTNNYLLNNIEKDKNNAFRVFYGVQESFLTSWHDSIKEKWGSLNLYIKNVLDMDEGKIDKLKSMYLE